MATRNYEKDGLIVHWDSELCYHSAHCLRSAPLVFDSKRRPWVRLELGTEEEIIAAVESCPSGALSYGHADDGPDTRSPTTVLPRRNGPLIVTGRIQILADDGAVVRESTRLALCRCGNSDNRPYCDGSHARSGFRDPGIGGGPSGSTG